ncbi:hypothetical protein [Streptomyces sp. NPDC001820]|uniref:hypothetical protein n=1 Tax=Streptomyces sp. NPDC001820 TaxID=3364613 RepID=UPI0036A43A1C
MGTDPGGASPAVTAVLPAEGPVWLFSSGPLDPSASARDIPPVPAARRAEQGLIARDMPRSGGRLEAGARGRITRAILEEGRGGDFRDFDRIAAWATGVAAGPAAEAERR